MREKQVNKSFSSFMKYAISTVLFMMMIVMLYGQLALAAPRGEYFYVNEKRYDATQSVKVSYQGWEYVAPTKTFKLLGGKYQRLSFSFHVSNLTVAVTANTTYEGACFTFYGNTTITDQGKLTLRTYMNNNPKSSVAYWGIYACGGNLTIDTANLDITAVYNDYNPRTNAAYAITGNPESAGTKEKLTIINSKIHAYGTAGAICDFHGGIYGNSKYLAAGIYVESPSTVECRYDGFYDKKGPQIYDVLTRRYRQIAQEVTIAREFWITQQPKTVSAVAGSTATFTVKANCQSATYQWQYYNKNQRKWVNVSGATSNTLSVTVSENDAEYQCLATCGGLTVVSLTARTKIMPKITQQPINTYVPTGWTTRLKIQAEGATKYQWQYMDPSTERWRNVQDNEYYSGATTATLTINTLESMNQYQFRCRVTNAYGNGVTSDYCILGVRTYR
jgi:hypothetical protein